MDKYINYLKLLTIVFIMTFMSCDINTEKITKPKPFEFGISMAEAKESVLPLCDSIIELMDEPIQLPTALKFQSQLDCINFMYAGKKRKVELVFADDALDMIWILTEAEEESFFIKKFIKLYGEPSHIKDDITFFLENGVAVRNQPHEVLFISERLKAPYKEWLNSSN